MSDIAINVENLSKRYRIGLKEEMPDTLVGAMKGWLRSPLANFRQLRRLSYFSENGADPEDVIWALKDVSFEVKQGEVIGIIGRNGAGKSTVLKILSRITEPTSGRAVINGRVSSLLEVGTGFHPELTGRENIYLNGTVLGMTKKEIDRKFDEIVDFAGVEKFIDTPVKRYSSGMQVRLAFAVAAHLEPEILLVDEVLAVGDAAFQRKSLGKMESVSKTGRTIFFVSHNMGMINSLCERVIWLDFGHIVTDGVPDQTISSYLKNIEDQNEVGEVQELHFTTQLDLPSQIVAVRLLDKAGNIKTTFDILEPIIIELDYIIREPTEGSHLQAVIFHQGSWIFSSWDTDTAPERFYARKPGQYRARIELPSPLFKGGHYQLKVTIGIANVGGIHVPQEHLGFDVQEGSMATSLMSYAQHRPGRFVIPLDWEICSMD
jgi:lipopolysaccharide transport system ATP-binding protein